MNVILFDNNEVRKNLLPLTYTRPIARLRIGITTIEDKWRLLLGEKNRYSHLTATYLTTLFPARVTADNLLVAAHVVPDEQLAAQVAALQRGDALMQGETLIAYRGSAHGFDRRSGTSRPSRLRVGPSGATTSFSRCLRRSADSGFVNV